MTRLLLAAAVVLAAAVAPASAARQDTCITWGPTVTGVPSGACIPVQCDGCVLLAEVVRF